MTKYIDCHMHSINSDGKYSVEELVNIANLNNVETISITDHDNINSIYDIKKIKCNINYINGVELSTETIINGTKKHIHILGYDFDNSCEELYNILEEKKEIRSKINLAFLKKMVKELTFLNKNIIDEIVCDKFIRFSRLIIKNIESHNYAKEELELVKKYLETVKIIYPSYNFSEKEAIDIIKKSNGIPVLAHPYQYRISENEERKLIKDLMDIGLIGLETYHSGDSLLGFELQNKLAKEYNLITTVGSDFHTDENETNRVGYGENNNLCKDYCSLLSRVRK